jgi:hypothetical protein
MMIQGRPYDDIHHTNEEDVLVKPDSQIARLNGNKARVRRIISVYFSVYYVC